MNLREFWGETFDQGFICGLVSLYAEFPCAKEAVFQTLRGNGFKTLDEAMSAKPDEYDARFLREIYGVDDDD